MKIAYDWKVAPIIYVQLRDSDIQILKEENEFQENGSLLKVGDSYDIPEPLRDEKNPTEILGINISHQLFDLFLDICKNPNGRVCTEKIGASLSVELLYDNLYTSINTPAVQELLAALGIYSAHLREILADKKTRNTPSLVSTLSYELANLYRKTGCKNIDFIGHLQAEAEYYDPMSSRAVRCNAGNYLGSPMTKYVEREPPLEIIKGEISIAGHAVPIKGQLLPRLKTLSLSKHVIENLLIPNTILVDIGTGTGAIPLFISQQDKEKKLALTLGYDLEYTLEIDGNKFQEKAHGVSTRAEIEKDLTQRSIFPQQQIVITANLPYGTQEDYKKYPNRVKKEPLQALLGGGEDGLDIYRSYILGLSQSNFLKNISGIIFEGSSKNIASLFDLCKQYFPGFAVKLLPDCFGKERFVQMKIMAL